MSDSASIPTLTADEAKDLDSKLQGLSGSLSTTQRKYLAYAMHLADESDADVQGHAWTSWSSWSWE